MEQNKLKIPNKHEILEIPVHVKDKNSLPCVELRKSVTDADLMKTIITAAFHENPIVLLPRFRNKLQSLNSLVEKGLMYVDDEGAFEFTLSDE